MKFKLVGIGEVLWDLLPGGRQLGGAPANFACHAAALGAESWIVSRVGNDPPGREILERFNRFGVNTSCVEIDPGAPTGTVSVEVSSDGQPRFTIHENAAWDRIAGEATAAALVASADAICFGTLAQRSEISRAGIRRLLAAAPPGAWRVLDVNLRQNYFSPEVIEQSLARANVVKMNEIELPQIAGILGLEGDARGRIRELAGRFRLRAAACTRGANGSLLFANGRWSDHPGIRAKVVDTVGAGDSFTAAMTIGLLAGWDLDAINERANQVAAYVASRAGGTPRLPDSLREPFIRSMSMTP